VKEKGKRRLYLPPREKTGKTTSFTGGNESPEREKEDFHNASQEEKKKGKHRSSLQGGIIL